jgi:hypothetical protein
MAVHHLKVTTTNGAGPTAVVELDGQRIEGALSGLEMRLNVKDINRAALELAAPVIEFDGKAEVFLPEETQALLKRLGWTPPD